MSDRVFTLEELNYFRVCYITANIIRDGLQSVFKQEWDRIHGWRLGTWQDTAKNGMDFFNLESPRSRNKNKRFLNVIQTGNTAEWDCACFFFAILFSDSLGPLLKPSVASNVDDLRDFRNGVFAHLSQASIAEVQFQASVQLVSNAFTALNLQTSDLQNITNQWSFPTGELQKLQEQIVVLEEEVQGKTKSFVLLPLKPSHEVTERKAETEDIMEMFSYLQNANEDDSIVTVYLTGNPGSGKSQIARQVGERFAGENHNGNTFVMTLNAESEDTMLDSYKKFSRALGITEYSLNSVAGGDSKLTKKEQISHLKTLASTKVRDYSFWLLIFDNVYDLTSVRGCLPDDEEWGSCGQILVTTQDSINLPFADPFCKNISLSQGMQTNDALNLLRNISQFSSSDEDEEHLVLDALDYQPLAIASAALYVRYLHDGVKTHKGPGSFTWKSYLKKLEMGKRIATEKVYEKTSKSYPLSMTTAVTLALRRLVQNHGFEYVAQFLALCAPEPIGHDILVRFVTQQDQNLDEDMVAAEISKCCLLLQLCPDDSPRTLIRVHQVVYDVLKSYFYEKYTKEEVSVITQSYIETLSTFAEHNLLETDLEFHMLSKMMAPHLKLRSTHLDSKFNWALDIVADKKNVFQNAFLNFGDICSKHCYFSAAKTYFEYSLHISNADGDDQNESKAHFIATIRNNLGGVYHELGQFGKAKEHHQCALALMESLSPENPTSEIADSLNKLGTVFFSLGQFEEAKDHFLRSLDIRILLYGNEHADIAASLSNLGSAHSALDDMATAANLFEESLAVRERIYGKVHPAVADSLNNLGLACSKIGLFEKAIKYHKNALEMRQKLFFPDHMLISHSYNNLGLAYKFFGQLEETKICYESALRIREKILDKEHPAVAGLLSNLGVLYMDLGELQRSKDFQTRALQIRIKVLGREHCKVGDCMLNLGLVHELLSQYDLAAIHFQQAVDIYDLAYPTNHTLYQSAVNGVKRVSGSDVECDPRDLRSSAFHADYRTRSVAFHAEYSRTRSAGCCVLF